MENHNIKKEYYIYWHLDPRTSLPVYTGKGKGDRAWDFCLRHVTHKEWVKELATLGLKPVVLVGNRFESEKEAYQVEKEEIALLRKLNLKMFNISSGGVGVLSELRQFCKKPIVCVTTGKSYDSTASAAMDLNLQAKRINGVLKGKKKSYKGYVFKYLDENLNKEPKKIRKNKEFRRKTGTTVVKVVCVETGKEYISVIEAARDIGVTSSAIHGNLIGRLKHVKSLTFKKV